MNLYASLRSAATHAPGSSALLTLDAETSFADLLAMVDRVAGGLARASVTAADRVAIYSGSRLEVVVAYYACFRIGAVVVPIGTKLASEDVRSLLADSGASYCIGEAEAIRRNASVFGAASLQRTWLLDGIERAPGVSSWQDLIEAAPCTHDLVPDEALAAILYTSGTTGRAKGFVHTHASLAAGAQLAAHQGADSGPGIFVMFDLAHGWAIECLLAALQNGHSFLLSPDFETNNLLSVLQHRKPSWVVGIPSTYRALLDHLHSTGTRLEIRDDVRFVVGGDACSLQLKQSFQNIFGRRLLNSYGSNDIGGPATLQPDRDFDDALVIGAPLPGIEVRFESAPGNIGELAVLSPSQPVGIWDGHGVDRSAPRGWVATGDIVRRAPDGCLFFIDRAKDIIKIHSIAVSPIEIERVLASHPAVAGAVVFAMADSLSGESPAALLQLRPGAQLDEQALRHFLLPRLAQYKHPKQIHFVDELPLTSGGKVGRRKLSALYALPANEG